MEGLIFILELKGPSHENYTNEKQILIKILCIIFHLLHVQAYGANGGGFVDPSEGS